MRARRAKGGGQRISPANLIARLSGHVTLAMLENGTIVASFDGHSEVVGKFSASPAERAKLLSTGVPIESFASDAREVETEVHLLVRRLASRGLVEFELVCSRTGQNQIVIEPLVPDYWPRIAPLDKDDVLVLSRFAYMRRRANEMVLEFAALSRIVQNLRSDNCGSTGETSDAAENRATPPERRLSRCRAFRLACGLPSPSQDRSANAKVVYDQAKVTLTSFFGIFTICSFTPAARKADTPTQRAAFFPTPAA